MVEDRISAVNGGMLMRRYELTDEQYALLEPSLPRMQRTDGHLWSDHRRALNGLFWKLRSGAPWRAIPTRYGPWSSISDRYRRWCRAG
ncbi:transposase [Chloroflexus aggregans]|uniref:transposase n=1 Tax=Chloroflexus aggregans TaxID=152260 RepID=UPI000A05DF6A